MGVSSFIGKGLREPVDPFRTAYFFGAPLNSVSADNWDALPTIVDQVTTFDLSSISPYHEVVVALIKVSDSPKGYVNFNFKWYKDSPRTLLFNFSWSFYCPDGGWCYSYSYIGWVPWEIDKNGAYHVDVTVSGVMSHSRTINFTVSGIPAAPTPPPAPPQPVTTIIEHLNSVSAFFYSIYTETLSWVWPFWLVATPFYNLSWTFSKLAWAFYYFNDWVIWVTNNIGAGLLWDAIKGLILGWLPKLPDTVTWFINLVSEFKTFAADPIQWSKDKFKSTILPWAIDNIPLFGTLYKWYHDYKPELELFFDNPTLYLRGKFETAILPWAIDNIPFISTLYVIYAKYAGEFGLFLDDPVKWLRDKFEDNILPWAKNNIPFFAAITVLIDTITDEMVVFLSDPLQWLRDNTIWGSVEEFFADPLEWLWGKFADWFLGPEE